jgi:hypothetical protein
MLLGILGMRFERSLEDAGSPVIRSTGEKAFRRREV